MTREQAINYLFSCGFTNEQVGDVVRALTYEPTTKNDSSELEKNSKKLEKDFGELDCISREQAIKILKSKMNGHTDTSYEWAETVRMAIKALEQEPTTKNILPHCQHSDEEIAKSFIEDVEAVKDQLPCFCEQMDFPNTFDEFADYYGFKDTEEVYTNGNDLIQVFRVKQWLEHISTTKNDLGVEEVTALAEWTEKLTKASEDAYNKGYADGMKAHEPRKGHWIKGYTFPDGAYWKCDKCNELIKVKFPMNYCNNCGADMREVENDTD